ncbi:MAG: hypothetical protein OEZ29_01310 [Candidatus Bathyarchaeota archaeon]|nr:hypothetical protein [Candidatus Bathyarchaeota archaeon]
MLLSFSAGQQQHAEPISDDFSSKVADNVEGDCGLVEKSFEYVGHINYAEIFRKSK